MFYSEIRDYVTDKAAAACDGVQLEAIMKSALLEMWGRQGDLEPEITKVITTVADQAAYSLTSTAFERVLRVVDVNGCTIPAHVPSCNFYPCDCDEYEESWPLSYKLTGVATLTLVPTPDTAGKTYTVYGLGEPDTTLWDMDGSTKVWREVVLPTGLHMAYAENVLARVLADVDPGRSQVWLSMSNAGFDTWKDRQRRSSGKDHVVMARQAVKAWVRGRRPLDENSYQRWTG